MASDQVFRRDPADIVEEKTTVVEFTAVPVCVTSTSLQKGRGEESKQRDDVEQEMATKDDPEYESLAEKVKGMDLGQLKESYGESEESMKKHESVDETGRTGEPTLEEISKARASAQQNSMEILRAAEEKYNQAKEKGNQGLGMVTEEAAVAKGKATDGAQVMKEFATDKGSQAVEKAAEMRDKVAEGAQVAKDYAAEKGGQATEKAVEVKDKAVGSTYSTAHYVAEKGAAAKGVVLEKGQQGLVATKDTVVSAAVTAKDYTVPKVVEAKDKTVEATKGVVGYAGEKVTLAKDKTVETGKQAAEYAGKVAADMKDKAVVVSWEAAHYTTEKAVEGAKVAAGVVQGVAGKAGEIAAKPLVAAKDMTAATAEKTREYTARKKEEAERQHEAMKNSGTDQTGGHDLGVAEEAKEHVGGGTEKASGTDDGSRDIPPGVPSEEEMEQEAGGVLGAIGETLVGIAETTKQMVIGQDDPEEVQEEEAGIRRSCSSGTDPNQ